MKNETMYKEKNNFDIGNEFKKIKNGKSIEKALKIKL